MFYCFIVKLTTCKFIRLGGLLFRAFNVNVPEPVVFLTPTIFALASGEVQRCPGRANCMCKVCIHQKKHVEKQHVRCDKRRARFYN